VDSKVSEYVGGMQDDDESVVPGVFVEEGRKQTRLARRLCPKKRPLVRPFTSGLPAGQKLFSNRSREG
jgi:hypothetical protein